MLTTTYSTHPSLQYTHTISEISLPFLDINLHITGNCLQPSVYYKETDTHSYLHHQSSHPWHSKNSLPYSQLLRLRHMHLCSDDYDFTTRAKLTWIPGLLTLGSQNWKTVPDFYLRKFGGLNVLLRCKYNVKDITSIPLFNQNILVYFNEFKALYNFDQAHNFIQ